MSSRRPPKQLRGRRRGVQKRRRSGNDALDNLPYDVRVRIERMRVRERKTLIMGSKRDACRRPVDVFGLARISDWAWINDEWNVMGELLAGEPRPVGGAPVVTLPLTVKQVHTRHRNALLAGPSLHAETLESIYRRNGGVWLTLSNTPQCLAWVKSELGRRVLRYVRRLYFSFIEPTEPQPWDNSIQSISMVNQVAFGDEAWEHRATWQRRRDGSWKAPPFVNSRTQEVVGKRHFNPAVLVHAVQEGECNPEEMAMSWRQCDGFGNVKVEQESWVDREFKGKGGWFEEAMRGLRRFSTGTIRLYCEPWGATAGIDAGANLRHLSTEIAMIRDTVRSTLNSVCTLALQAVHIYRGIGGGNIGYFDFVRGAAEILSQGTNEHVSSARRFCARAQQIRTIALHQELVLEKARRGQDPNKVQDRDDAVVAHETAKNEVRDLTDVTTQVQGTPLADICRKCVDVAKAKEAIARCYSTTCAAILEVGCINNSLPATAGAQEVANLTGKVTQVWFLDNLRNADPGSVQPSYNLELVPQHKSGRGFGESSQLDYKNRPVSI